MSGRQNHILFISFRGATRKSKFVYTRIGVCYMLLVWVVNSDKSIDTIQITECDYYLSKASVHLE